MARLNVPTRAEAPELSAPILDKVGQQLGFVPNLHRIMAQSPAVLTGWLGLMTALSTTLDLKTRDGIALAVSHINGCDYCLAAHSYVSARFAHLSAEEINRNRQGYSEDPKRQAAIRFAQQVIESRGNVDEAELGAVRTAGYTDANLVEIVALVGQFSLTNFLNNVAMTPIDFDAIDTSASAFS